MLRQVYASLAACGELAAAAAAQALGPWEEEMQNNVGERMLRVCRQTASMSMAGGCCAGQVKPLGSSSLAGYSLFDQVASEAYALDQSGTAGKHLVNSAHRPQETVCHILRPPHLNNSEAEDFPSPHGGSASM